MNRVISWIVVSGLIWFVIGFFLLSKGINLSVYSLTASYSPFLSFLSNFTKSPEQSVLLLISLALLLGYIKGRFVLLKTVKRVVSRILSLQEPVKATQVYSKNYLFLIFFMVLIGFSIRYLPVAQDIRGFIDLTIGSALMNGALLYFRFAYAFRKINQENQN